MGLPNPSIVAPIVSGISAFVRMDGQTDRRTWLSFIRTDRQTDIAIYTSASDPDQEYIYISASNPDQEYIYFLGLETLPSACFILSEESSIPYE